MKTVSLELAKQLKEARYPQESEFVWSGFKESYPINLGIRLNGHIAVRQINDRDEEIGLNVLPNSEYEVIIAAPTAEEILDLLPNRIRDDKNDLAPLIIRPWNGTYDIAYHLTFNAPKVEFQDQSSLAEAAAKMWLYLKENKLL